MISYHPDSRFLIDFASASLPMSESVCVSAHLEFCSKCRAHVQQLADVGGHLLAHLEPQQVGKSSFERLMARIDDDVHTPQATAATSVSGSVGGADPASPVQDTSKTRARTYLPRALQRLSAGGLHNLGWVQFGKALRVAPIAISGDPRATAIYDIKAGGRMLEHEHRGEEITVLLKGSFSDTQGNYSQGDFVVRTAGETHQPMATQDTDCVCLVSLERPVRACGLFYRALEPYVQYRLRKMLVRNAAM